MAFLIKDKELDIKHQKLLQNQDSYTAFPTAEQVAFDETHLLPIGLISGLKHLDEDIFIAMPRLGSIFDGDFPIVTYSLTDKGWVLDEEYLEDLDYDLEDEYMEHYHKAKAYFAQHQHLRHGLKEAEDKEPLFELGGQPPLGQNWCANLYDEMGDYPELDDYFDVMEEGSGEDYERMKTREITYQDEEDEREYVFLGLFSYELYFEGGGECIVFYQPQLKKVMVVAEFS